VWLTRRVETLTVLALTLRAPQASITSWIRRVIFNVELMDVIWQSAVGLFPRVTTLMETEAAQAVVSLFLRA